ncbi:MAG TPA: DUF2203 domain-containing protein [Anaeromyxobacter sp.]
MDDGPRFFTIEEANELVSSLEIEFGRIARARAELAPLIEALGGAEASVAILHDGEVAPPGREPAAERLRRLAAEITESVERVNELGCLVKDVELGLVDFYALQDGEPVLLCWQFGEPAVTHWHGVDEGYAGRKPIEGVSVRPPSFPN